LGAYLESKQKYFPRFYFLPNEDLIEILGDANKPKLVTKHLSKIFEGIYDLEFKSVLKEPLEEGDPPVYDEQILKIISREGEEIALTHSIFPLSAEFDK
jgi:hypothetical protein